MTARQMITKILTEVEDLDAEVLLTPVGGGKSYVISSVTVFTPNFFGQQEIGIHRRDESTEETLDAG